MPLNNSNILAFVAEQFDALSLRYVFIGGAVLEFLVDQPEMSEIRPTDDLDVVVEVVASVRYSQIEEKLREIGFEHDTRTGAPMCRWIFKGLVVDVMPADGAFMSLNTRWFNEAVELGVDHWLNGRKFRVISPVVFLATKLTAFEDRGNRDYLTGRDIEDIMTVIDGRASIVEEFTEAPPAMREFISCEINRALADPSFHDALPGYLPSDRGSQNRLPELRTKLRSIAAL